MARTACAAALALGAALASPASTLGPAVSASTLGPAVSVCASNTTWICVDGRPTHEGTSVQGFFLNSRMIQGVFDDRNASTVGLWRYPDGSPYSPDRQTDEFVGNLSSYARCGLDGFTVGMQGGGPQVATPPDQPWASSGFGEDGTPDPLWLARLTRVLDGAAAAGLVPVVSLFYQGQIERLAGDAAVAAAVDAMVDFLVAGGRAGRVVLELANEVGEKAFPPSLRPDTVAALLTRAKQRSNGTLLVTTSWDGGAVPPDSAIAASDVIEVHCNGLTPEGVARQLAAVRSSAAYRAAPKPIYYNECNANLTIMEAAISGGVGWGYYDQGSSDYVDGFQSPPTNWNASAAAQKRDFFKAVAALAGMEGTCEASQQER